MNYEAIVSTLSVFFTALFAIYTIRKTAEQDRISNTHTEMSSCLVDTVFILSEVITLLEDISNHVTYTTPSGEIIETAYARYWNKIQTFAERYKEIQIRQKLFFPKKLYDGITEILKQLNKARNLVKKASPNNNVYPDTTKLLELIDEIDLKYENFINSSRSYLGPKSLTIIDKSGEILISNEDKKS